MQWGLSATSDNWNNITPFAISFNQSCYASAITLFNPDGSPTSGMYRDYGGIKHKTNLGIYAGFGKVGYKFLWLAIGK